MTDYKNTTSWEDVFSDIFNDREKLTEFLNYSFSAYLNDGNFEIFYRSLELAMKAQDTMAGFARKTDLSKTGLYNIVKGKKEPKITTLVKILKELGFTLELKETA